MDNNNQEIPQTTAADRVSKMRAEKKQDKKQSFWTKEIDRREVLKKGAGAILAGGAALLLGDLVSSVNFKPSSDTPKSIPKPNTEPFKPPEIIKPPEGNINLELANKILNLPPNGPERLNLEKNYVTQAQTLEEIDRGFWTVCDKDLRVTLLNKRLKIREEKIAKSGDEELKKEWEEKKKWAIGQKINPEVLGICMDAYPKALEIINKLRDRLRPDLKGVNIIIEDLLLSPGGMARLVCFETGLSLSDNLSNGFSNIGQVRALSQINTNTDGFPNDPEALGILTQHLSEDNGLKFNKDTTPGSYWGDHNLNKSGGAIGLQFMPGAALEVYNLLQEVRYKFNPFDPVSSVIGAWVFLAKRIDFIDKEGKPQIRHGYRWGNLDQMRGGIQKWNNFPNQVTQVMMAQDDYYAKFIGNKKYKY